MEDKKVIVIGGSNMDVQGFPDDSFTLRDSNPGQVSQSCGGVARNIAENLGRLEVDVCLISVVGNDANGKTLKMITRQAGVDVKDIEQINGKPTSTYLSILDGQGDMIAAINDMALLKNINIPFLEKKFDVINNGDYLVLDANLSQNAIDYIFDHFSDKKIYVDTVSIPKSQKYIKHFQHIDCLRPNRLEAEFLTNTKIKNDQDMDQAGKKLLDMGIKKVIICWGKNGIYFYSQDQSHHMTAPPVDIVNVTGAGDSVTAAFVYADVNNLAVESSISFALGAAALTLKHPKSCNPNLSHSNITKYMEEYKNA
ncbi:MAG: carbohydrate kinase family protein [Spirochaetes bacterium]|nr:carbohydrate kinase family protein [Spirochaetota bacterium]